LAKTTREVVLSATLCEWRQYVFLIKNYMKTEQLLKTYFQKVKEKSDWQNLIAAQVKFESPTSGTAFGKEAFLTAASRFFKMVETLEVKHVITEGQMGSAWIDYSLRLENGKQFNCLVSELYEVHNDEIASCAIMFDTLALKTFRSEN
jgi:hypothetical protein